MKPASWVVFSFRERRSEILYAPVTKAVALGKEEAGSPRNRAASRPIFNIFEVLP